MKDAQIFYIISLYHPDSEQLLQPEWPERCPCQEPDGECKIHFNHYRDRKTGPCFPLAVMRCAVHRKGFTVYPPGHVPYGRKPIAPVAPDGSLIRAEDPNERLVDTYFDAAIDAAQGRPWPHYSFEGNLDPRFRTQTRHLDRLGRLFGIHPEIDTSLREELAGILSLPGQLTHIHTCLFKEKPGFQNRGASICELLQAIPYTTSLYERIAEAGAAAGLWPCPLFWSPRGRILRNSQFHHIRTRASP